MNLYKQRELQLKLSKLIENKVTDEMLIKIEPDKKNYSTFNGFANRPIFIICLFHVG